MTHINNCALCEQTDRLHLVNLADRKSLLVCDECYSQIFDDIPTCHPACSDLDHNGVCKPVLFDAGLRFSNKSNAKELLLFVAKYIGWPKYFKKDVEHDIRYLALENRWTHFAWILRECGTDLLLMQDSNILCDNGRTIEASNCEIVRHSDNSQLIYWFVAGKMFLVETSDIKDITFSSTSREALYGKLIAEVQKDVTVLYT